MQVILFTVKGLTILCNVHWIHQIMDGCLYKREDVPGNCFGRRMPSLQQELFSIVLGKELCRASKQEIIQMPRVSKVMLFSFGQALILECQPFPYVILLTFPLPSMVF